ncbi:hypothetical protein KSS87_013946 [Heliosperma pusillum]|nr:hypothetical protein KSS87_013946 [Heliosperma pusillum]
METSLLELEVKIISRETVKPSTPTPSHLRTFNLSMVDQISPTMHVSSLIFYNQTTETQPLDITVLKLALSQTLVDYYPLAGRCKDESTIICNDEGVPFIVAHVNCTLSAVLGSSSTLDLSTKFQFLPPMDILSTGEQHISELSHLAFQVNVFRCGGVVIGCYMLHKILDGISFGLFLQHWSALARNKFDDDLNLTQPDFKSTVIAFPPYQHHPEPQQKQQDPEPEQELEPELEPDKSSFETYIPTYDSLKKVGKGFIFSEVALTKLKAMAASKHVPNPTRFESVVGFIWEQCLATESVISKHTESPVLYFSAEMRKRIGAPLSENSIGNLIANPIAFTKTGASLPELVTEIHDAILKLKDETANEFISGGGDAVLTHRAKLDSYFAGYKKGSYLSSSWCRNGLSEADFGFGKPRLIVFPVMNGEVIPVRNLISFTDYNDPEGKNGIVAWIYLEEKEMQILESNQEFLAFTSKWKFDGMAFPVSLTNSEHINTLLADELSYDKNSLREEHKKLLSSMTIEQRKVYDEIIEAVGSGKGGVFFVYGYGGTGKTFIWRTLCAALRSTGDIVLPVASSGIAAILLPSGRTTHSRFGIPINVGESFTCSRIKPGTDLSELLIKTKLIIWDEAPMTHKHCFEALDRSLRDIMRFSDNVDHDQPFGGKVVVFGGDFRQILPVVPKGSRADIVHASLCSSDIWFSCKVLTLTKNMRLQCGSSNSNEDEIREFSNWILNVGNGVAGGENDGEIDLELPSDILITDATEPIAAIVHNTFPSFCENFKNSDYLQERAILAPTHEIVEMVNDFFMSLIPNPEKVYLSSYEISKDEGNTEIHEIYSTEFLNSIKCSGLPNHELKLKVGATIMLLRNIDQPQGLCNGTRLVVTNLGSRVIRPTVLTGSNKGDRVHIARITLTPSDATKFPVRFERR